MKKSIPVVIVAIIAVAMTSCRSFSNRWAEGAVDGSLSNYFKIEDFNIDFHDSTAMIAINLRYELSNNAQSYEFDANERNRSQSYSVQLVGTGGRELPVVMLFDDDGKEIKGSEMTVSEQGIRDMEYALMFGAKQPIKVKCVGQGWDAAKVKEMTSEAYSFALVGNIKKTTQGELDSGSRVSDNYDSGESSSVGNVVSDEQENQEETNTEVNVEDQVPSTEQAPAASTSNGGYIQIDASNIPFRLHPGNIDGDNIYCDASGHSVTTYPGQMLESLGRVGDWYKVIYHGNVLYVPANAAHQMKKETKTK